MYNRTSRAICQDCIAEEEEAFQLVRAYLKDHRDASLHQVVAETGVDEDLILEMIYQGRLYLGDNPNLQYPCERCGSPAGSGRYCNSCASQMGEAFASAQQELRTRHTMEKNRRGYFSK